MLLAMAERRLGLADNLARVFPDRRDPARVVHSLVNSQPIRVRHISRDEVDTGFLQAKQENEHRATADPTWQ